MCSTCEAIQTVMKESGSRLSIKAWSDSDTQIIESRARQN